MKPGAHKFGVLVAFLLASALTRSWAANATADVGRQGIVVGGHGSDVRVQIAQSVHVRTNETVQNVVVVFGDVTIDGTVEEEVVVVCGDAVINGKVGGNVVASMGTVRLGPNAIVEGEVVGVGGGVNAADGAKVSGETVNIDIAGLDGLKLEGLRSFIRHCVLQLRPLSFKVGWIWWVAGAFLLGYIVLTAAFPRPVDAGVTALNERPALSFLLGLLALPLLGLIGLLLAITGVGVLVVPFLCAGLVIAAFIGKASVMRYLGHQIGRQLNAAPLQQPLIALLMGAAILTLFYLIPFVGLAAWAVASMWGMGAILMALGGRFRREAPAAAGPSSPTPGWSVPLAVATPVGTTVAPDSTTTLATPLTGSTVTPISGIAASSGPIPSDAGAPPPIDPATGAPRLAGVAGATLTPEAWSLPRVGFWRRALATLLDTILLAVVTGSLEIMPVGFLLWVAYYAAMWAWKSTTIGGIVVGIKVVRLDGRPMDFATALVRAFGAVFSTIVLGLGYFWAGWDRDKQGWHDKIAGTVVVRVPQGQPLVMI